MNDLSLLACTPVPVISQIAGGPGVLLSHQAGGMFALFIVVALKVALFAVLTRPRIDPWRSGWSMFLGNVASSLAGFFIALAIAVNVPSATGMHWPKSAIVWGGPLALGVGSGIIAFAIRDALERTPLRLLTYFLGPIAFLLAFAANYCAHHLYVMNVHTPESLYLAAKFTYVASVVTISLMLAILLEAATAIWVLQALYRNDARSADVEDFSLHDIAEEAARATLVLNLWLFFSVFLWFALKMHRRLPFAVGGK